MVRQSLLRTRDLGFVVEGMPIGARPNHVFFVGNLAYVTVGGPPPSATNPDPAGKIVVINRTTHAVDYELTGPALTGEPHAIWATPGGKLYVGYERGNKVSAIDPGDANNPPPSKGP